jgi:predicted metal-dependent hydrolase
LTTIRTGASQAQSIVRFAFDEVEVEVTLKRVKNLRLVVSPPDGRVRISAPRRMGLETVRGFALAKLEWIRRQQSKMRAHLPSGATTSTASSTRSGAPSASWPSPNAAAGLA